MSAKILKYTINFAYLFWVTMWEPFLQNIFSLKKIGWADTWWGYLIVYLVGRKQAFYHFGEKRWGLWSRALLRVHCAFEDICFFINLALLWLRWRWKHNPERSGLGYLRHCHRSAGPSERHWGPHTQLLGTEGVIHTKCDIFSQRWRWKCTCNYHPLS